MNRSLATSLVLLAFVFPAIALAQTSEPAPPPPPPQPTPAFAPPAGSPAGTASTPFAADIDNGIVTYDANGTLHSIEWQSYMLGAQYCLDGKMWISGNYSHMFSDNMHLYGTATKLTSVYDWFDVNLFVDPTPSVRVGAEYANFNTQYVDGAHAINHRAQLSGFFIF